MSFKNSYVPNVGKSFYDNKKTNVDPQKDFLNLTPAQAQRFTAQAYAPRFIELIDKMPLGNVRYENGNPSLTTETIIVSTPYGKTPIKQQRAKHPQTQTTNQQTNTQIIQFGQNLNNNPQQQNQTQTQTQTIPCVTNNDLVAIMSRRKHLHLFIIVLLVLILIILLLKN